MTLQEFGALGQRLGRRQNRDGGGVSVAGGSASGQRFDHSGSVPVLVMVAAFSLFIAAVMLPSRQTMVLVAGMWQLLSQSFTAVPHELWWDSEAGIGRRGRLTDPVTALMGTLGSRLVQLKPYDPESKGMVERANRYLETSFLPERSFTSPDDFNAQLEQWLPTAKLVGCGSSTGGRSISSNPIEPRCWLTAGAAGRGNGDLGAAGSRLLHTCSRQ